MDREAVKMMAASEEDSGQLYRSILENIGDRVFAKDTRGRYIFFNKASCAFWGISPDTVLGRTDWEMLPEARARRYTQSDQFVLKKQITYHGEEREKMPNGRERIHAVVKAPLMDEKGRILGLVGIIRDITEQKHSELEGIETERRLRFLSSCLLRAQEVERNRLSKELHDELGQSLALLKHMLRSQARAVRDHQAPSIDEAVDFIDQIIENLRRISRDLSPTILEDLGLTASLKWAIENFIQKHDIEAAVDMIDIDDLFSPDVKIHVYRIVQESLTNIGKHAGATRIRVAVRKEKNDLISFSIRDDGQGFDPTQRRDDQKLGQGMGLDILVERAHMIDAQLKIDSAIGRGTEVMLHVPVSASWRVTPQRRH